jgi:hypothetical protein
MTFNNSLLLLIKQNPGIDFNDLLAKITPRYKNPSSAKSAIMRALKDMTSFGLVKREGSKIFITDKGLASMSIEMKDKLVLRLNEEMKHPLSSIDDIVRLLLVLSQRGSQDKDMLNNAKENSSFTISDVEELRKEIRAKRKHLKRMNILLEQQLEKLKEMDFNDSIVLPFNEEVAEKIALFSKGQKVVVETKDNDVLSKIPEHWKKSGTSFISVEGENINLLSQLLAGLLSAKAVLYLPGLKVSLMAGKATIVGPYKVVKQFSEIKLSETVSEEVKKVEETTAKTNPA